MRDTLGAFVSGLRRKSSLFKWLFFVTLALLVALNIILRPHHPHVDAEALPGFWAVFGLVLAVAMAVLMKGIVAPLIGFSEDIYDRDQ
ncbi:hypothetical protein V6C53_04840 [Desulfocurvibacter africanus]|uniref:hypothetical protein n=1 Tax=Desulfocurvibacter africanus TaxID=873 RepID=UPI002FDA2809